MKSSFRHNATNVHMFAIQAPQHVKVQPNSKLLTFQAPFPELLADLLKHMEVFTTNLVFR